VRKWFRFAHFSPPAHRRRSGWAGQWLLNHAAALGFGGQAALALAMLGPIEAELAQYQPYFATRADINRQLGHRAAALSDYAQAISLSTNAPERDWLAAQRRALLN